MLHILHVLHGYKKSKANCKVVWKREALSRNVSVGHRNLSELITNLTEEELEFIILRGA